MRPISHRFIITESGKKVKYGSWFMDGERRISVFQIAVNKKSSPGNGKA
jgi:hypothetical protein